MGKFLGISSGRKGFTRGIPRYHTGCRGILRVLAGPRGNKTHPAEHRVFPWDVPRFPVRCATGPEVCGGSPWGFSVGTRQTPQ